MVIIECVMVVIVVDCERWKYGTWNRWVLE